MRDQSFLLIALSTSLMVIACAPANSSPSPSPSPSLRSTRQAIIAGKSSTGDEQNAVVAIGFTGGGATGLTCTGTLIAPTLVLTARSCVADITDQNTFQDASATNFAIYSGANAGEKINAGVGAAATGKALYVPTSSGLEPNVAIILLDTAVNDGVAAIRLANKATASETIATVGFGYDEKNKLAISRRQRTGLSVLAIGPNQTEALNAGQFVTGESSCWGDIGGPAFSSKTKAVIGLSTTLGNGQDFAIDNPSGSCVGAGTRVVFNDLVSVKELIDRAMKAAGATPKLESAGKPTGGGKDKDDDDDSDDLDSENAETGGGDDDGENEDVDSSEAKNASFDDIPSQGCSMSPSPSSMSGSAEASLIGAALLASLVAIGFVRRRKRP